ncbi:hypothetical protein BB560_005746 [Smittium megazygosporum]|uniref:Anthranilate synthase component 2 n=1 Tax=Smittium megazygosporum TaxID=133381 RepID=A0A2T9YY56_9FUNG|nr:hypothetical protein BB560_005746 [Smittium megazygosporum]
MAVLLIDNYDSFTWNVYEGLVKAGAEVSVSRNDEITIEEIKTMNPSHIVLSPGPGHPKEPNGICDDVLTKFAGKIPILGVCMGLQLFYVHFGGVVDSAGEFVHGKTDIIHHDSKGIYKNTPRDFVATRYHSLICTQDSLPDCLEVTSTVSSGLIMGVRHKEFAIEGVQYHPDSFLSENQILMFKNFLTLRGGTWKENPDYVVVHNVPEPATKGETILEKIHKQRLLDIEADKNLPGRTFEDLEDLIKLGVAPPAIDFYKCLCRRRNEDPKYRAVISEVKRASPSKGDIGLKVNSVKMALQYAEGGASAISVLTEPTWFKGRIEDMIQIRKAFDRFGEDRPAILRKDFIIDKYQIAEARLYGADAVLLIVAMLTLEQLTDLLQYTHSLGMEALVEVNSETEVETALKAGSKIIGVNNRNLHSFNVEMNTTEILSKVIPETVFYISLSGVLNPSDALRFKESHVDAFLVGEGLMKATDKKQFIHDLVTVFA